jgi:hypothetical protein
MSASTGSTPRGGDGSRTVAPAVLNVSPRLGGEVLDLERLGARQQLERHDGQRVAVGGRAGGPPTACSGEM